MKRVTAILALETFYSLTKKILLRRNFYAAPALRSGRNGVLMRLAALL